MLTRKFCVPEPGRKADMKKPDKLQVLQIVKSICEKHRCTIQEIDFEKKILNIQGPPDDPDGREKCVEELEAMLELYHRPEDKTRKETE